MAGTQSHGSDTCCMSLMNLPQDILYNIFAHLDEGSLCEAAQICPAFLRLAGMQCLQLYINLVYHVMAQKRLTHCFVVFQAMQTSGCTCLRASGQVGILGSRLSSRLPVSSSSLTLLLQPQRTD